MRLFVGDSTSLDKPTQELLCAERMATEVVDTEWAAHDGGYKLLVLEHQLAADRAGFGNLYCYLHRYDDNRAREGTIGPLGVLRNVLLPLSVAATPDGSIDPWLEREALVPHARDLAPERLAELDPDAQRESFARVLHGARELRARWNAGDPSLADLLRCADDSALLTLDATLSEALATDPADEPMTARTPKPKVLAGALQCPWSEYSAYRQYVAGLSTHGTHQGVKGSEYERVLVVVDDQAAAGHHFAYEKLFGAKPPSASDRKNEETNKETSIDRTIRLLYVTCSRAQESLAVVLWTSSPDAVKRRALELGWFRPDEILDTPEDASSEA